MKIYAEKKFQYLICDDKKINFKKTKKKLTLIDIYMKKTLKYMRHLCFQLHLYIVGLY